MIVRLVSHSDFLFSELYQPLSVDLDTTRDSWNWRLLLENTTHLVEQSGDGQHDRGRLQVIPAVQEELSILISLCG